MPRNQTKQLHEVYTSNEWDDKTKNLNPIVQKMLKEPHLALYINQDWLHILPGMIIALVTDPTKVNGIAPYRLMKVNTKPGKEYIDLAAYSNNPQNSRTLRLGSRYRGHFASNITSADQAIESAVKAKQIAGGKDE